MSNTRLVAGWVATVLTSTLGRTGRQHGGREGRGAPQFSEDANTWCYRVASTAFTGPCEH